MNSDQRRQNCDCILRTVRGLPRGKVVTYGDISLKCYSKNNCGSAVSSAIKAETRRDRHGFPWWRVVKKGLRLDHLPEELDREEARRRLEGEGVRFCNDGSVHPYYRHELQ